MATYNSRMGIARHCMCQLCKTCFVMNYVRGWTAVKLDNPANEHLIEEITAAVVRHKLRGNQDD